MSPSPAPSSRPGLPKVWIAVGVAVVVLGLIAVLSARSAKDDSETVDTANTPVTTPAGAVVDFGSGADELQTAPVSVQGEGLPAYDGEDEDPAVGRELPTITGSTLAGTPITIGADGRAKVIVVVAHWCPHCQREVPFLMKHLAEHPLPEDVDLVAISTHTEPPSGNYPPSAWLKRERWWVPTLADSAGREAAAALGLAGYPFFVVVDAEGKVVGRASGEKSGDVIDGMIAAAAGR